MNESIKKIYETLISNNNKNLLILVTGYSPSLIFVKKGAEIKLIDNKAIQAIDFPDTGDLINYRGDISNAQQISISEVIPIMSIEKT